MPYLNQILGTIIASTLNYDQLCQAIGENPAINPATSSYAPCDGRTVVGSKLAQITGRPGLPDLRGKFLRGLNLIYSVGQPLPFDPNSNGDPETNRTIGNYQQDDFKSHGHGASSSSGFAFRTSGMGIQSDEGAEVQFGAPSITVHASGGSETRPRNVSVYFYIKIN